MVASLSNVTGEPGDRPAPVDGGLAPRLRQKRVQVARACDGCRTHRIKCDTDRPCSNCRSRGTHCSNSNKAKVSTLSQAYEQIGHLQQQVQELEAKLKQERSRAAPHHDSLPSPPTQSRSPSHASQSWLVEPNHGHAEKRVWEGIQLRPARSPQETWFGPSSLYHFIHRLSICLTSSLQQTHLPDHMLPNSASSGKLLDGPTAIDEDGRGHRAPPLQTPDKPGPYLSSIQEEYFLDLFWQSYHTSLFTILDEAEFKKHYQSLFMTSTQERKPSALVDIMLAMCMQYGMSTLPVGQQGSLGENLDATIAGRWHYRRCQKLLTYESESPTISTLQCHLLCAVYLCGASFHNMVDISCSLAVRTAYMLGLHLDPLQSMPQQERERRRRLWWAVYVLDSKVGMKLGRPFLLRDSYAMPALPADNVEAAMQSGSTFAPIGGNATWLSFNLHQAKLYEAVRTAHTAFYDRDLGLRDGETIWDSPQALDASAELLEPYKKHLEEWANGVPSALTLKRQNGGRPFSTDSFTLEIEQFAPLWLQRQRVLLELTYHHLCICLYRPIIALNPVAARALLAEKAATRCAAQAIAFTNISHHVLSSTSILAGWHEVFQWQWNAAMTLVGFVLTYPHGPSTPAARSAIDRSVGVFEIFGKSFDAAAGAAGIVRDLGMKIDLLARQSRPEQGVSAGYQVADPMTSLANFGNVNEGESMELGLPATNWSTDISGLDISMSDGLNTNLFDMALAVEFWGDFDTLWPNTGFIPEPWVLPQ